MEQTNLNLAAMACLPASLLLFTSCSSEPKPVVETSSAVAYQPGVPGGISVATHKLTATVKSIDAAKREVTLVTADGEKTTIKCGPNVINFDQIRIGDQLTATMTEEFIAYMADARTPNDGTAAAAITAPKGAKPGGVIADTTQVTAKVVAIDLRNHKATLQFPNGSIRTVAVRPDVDLTQRAVGEAVVLRTTGTLAINVETPQ